MMSFVELLLYSDSGLGVSSDKGRNVERSDRMTRVCCLFSWFVLLHISPEYETYHIHPRFRSAEEESI